MQSNDKTKERGFRFWVSNCRKINTVDSWTTRVWNARVVTCRLFSINSITVTPCWLNLLTWRTQCKVKHGFPTAQGLMPYPLPCSSVNSIWGKLIEGKNYLVRLVFRFFLVSTSELIESKVFSYSLRILFFLVKETETYLQVYVPLLGRWGKAESFSCICFFSVFSSK